MLVGAGHLNYDRDRCVAPRTPQRRHRVSRRASRGPALRRQLAGGWLLLSLCKFDQCVCWVQVFSVRACVCVWVRGGCLFAVCGWARCCFGLRVKSQILRPAGRPEPAAESSSWISVVTQQWVISISEQITSTKRVVTSFPCCDFDAGDYGTKLNSEQVVEHNRRAHCVCVLCVCVLFVFASWSRHLISMGARVGLVAIGLWTMVRKCWLPLCVCVCVFVADCQFALSGGQ